MAYRRSLRRNATLHEQVLEDERAHLQAFWRDRSQEEFTWTLGPILHRLPHFRVRRIAPKTSNDPWVYVSLGAWQATEEANHGAEFVVLAPVEDPRLVELLAMVTYFHADPRYRLAPGKTFNIGRPWMDGSIADHLLVSPPYPLGASFEHLQVDNRHIQFLWLVPISAREAELARAVGVEKLEDLLEESKVDVISPSRPSLA